MDYAILGGEGQLGRALKNRLGAAASAFGRKEADLTQPAALRAVLERCRPRVVFNCAAYNQVDRAESDPQAAFAVNAVGVRDLATICGQQGSVLIHFSTDYVFGLDVARRTPYDEGDVPGPLGVYAASKLAGEHFARAYCPRHFIVRTCGLYGESETNFVARILARGRAGQPVRVVNDCICTPTATADLAEAAVALADTGAFGLYHITNAGACSWHEFAQAAFDAAGIRQQVQPTTSAEYGAPARRPAYSVLAMNAYQRLGLPPLKPWREALTTFLQVKAGSSA